MPFFRTAFYKLMPSWLTTGEGELVHYSLGAVKDAFLQRWYDGVLARFPEYAPPDALAYLGRDRKVVRGIGESDESYAARLVTWRLKARVKGNPYALLEQIRAYINAPVRVRTVDSRGNWYTIEANGTRSALLAQGNWNWDGAAATSFSRFWVIIYPVAGDPWAVEPGTLGAGPWGNDLGDKSRTLGTDAETEHAAKLRAIIRDWQPDGTRCEWIIISYSDTAFDPAAANQPSPNPGTWGNWGKLDGSNNYVTARPSTHRFWKGAQV